MMSDQTSTLNFAGLLIIVQFSFKGRKLSPTFIITIYSQTSFPGSVNTDPPARAVPPSPLAKENTIHFFFNKNKLSLSQKQVPNHLSVTGIKWEFGANPELSPQL
jgi:hypothetical protein